MQSGNGLHVLAGTKVHNLHGVVPQRSNEQPFAFEIHGHVIDAALYIA